MVKNMWGLMVMMHKKFYFILEKKDEQLRD